MVIQGTFGGHSGVFGGYSRVIRGSFEGQSGSVGVSRVNWSFETIFGHSCDILQNPPVNPRIKCSALEKASDSYGL